MRSSHSQMNTYKKCPMYWHNNYVKKLKSPIEGASLHFGSGIDKAVEEMLEGKTDWMETFHDNWRKSWSFGKTTKIFDNDNIIYANKDHDKDVFIKGDEITLSDWAKQLGLTKKDLTMKECHNLFDAILKRKKNSYNAAPKPEEMKYYNRASWLSLKRKGEILLNSFKDQVMPKITKVISTQQRVDLKDEITKDSLVGYIDSVLELENYDKPIIFDLKTAARPYTDDQLEFSDQLTLYSAMKGKYALDKTNNIDTDLVGYIVLCKDINKRKVANCKSCNHIKTGRHKTCDNDVLAKAINKKERCNGDWNETVVLDPQVQIMVTTKSQKQVEDLLQDAASIIAAKKNGIVYKNTEWCSKWYGSDCPYKKLCHEGSEEGLVKK